MNANAKYTARELLTEAGVQDLDSVFGNVRVRVGGVRGIVSGDHVVSVPAGTESLQIVVGEETHEVSFDGDAQERVISEEVAKVNRAEGERRTAEIEARQEESEDSE